MLVELIDNWLDDTTVVNHLTPLLASARAAYIKREANGYGITLKSEMNESSRDLLGLLNGRLMNWCWKRVRTPLRDGF